MKKPVVWNSALALAGLGALLIYILACTSFSPDDSKVLYLTVDAKSGVTAVAVYDRKSAKSEVLFEPIMRDVADPAAAKAAVMRPQWLAGGHDFLAAWLSDSSDSKGTLNLAVQPFDRRGPARTFMLPKLWQDSGVWFYYWPLPVVGSSVFLNSETNLLFRLNLETGELLRHANPQELMVLPSPDNDRLFYLVGMGHDSNNPNEFGLLDPETFASKPLFQINDTNIAIMSLALSRDTKRLAYELDNTTPPVVRLLETGQPPRTLSLTNLGDKTQIMLRHFSPKGDLLYGSFMCSTNDADADFGVIEIPLDGSAIRKTTLIRGAPIGSHDAKFPSFQVDISHDGKTLAVESLWFAFDNKPVKAEDCALFLVDLTDPQRKVTKVPIPLPPKDMTSPLK